MPLQPDGTFLCECGQTRELLSPTDTALPAGEVVCPAGCASVGKPDTETDFTVAADGSRHHRLSVEDVATADAYYHARAGETADAAAPTPAAAEDATAEPDAETDTDTESGTDPGAGW